MILIAVPAMDTMPTLTAHSLLSLRQTEECVVSFVIRAQVYKARNMLAYEALDRGADKILWIDSDQTFDPDLLERLDADLADGWDMVTGLYFTRCLPVSPVIYKSLTPTSLQVYDDYPRDAVFPVAGCGFGAVLMRTSLLQRLEKTPFGLLPGVGEDLSFCIRAQAAGAKMACDSRVKVGHLGLVSFGEQMYRGR